MTLTALAATFVTAMNFRFQFGVLGLYSGSRQPFGLTWSSAPSWQNHFVVSVHRNLRTNYCQAAAPVRV